MGNFDLREEVSRMTLEMDIWLFINRLDRVAFIDMRSKGGTQVFIDLLYVIDKLEVYTEWKR